MGEIGILLRGANEAFRRSARRGSGFLACAALRARTSGRLLRPYGGAHSIRKNQIGAENRRLAKPSGAGFHPRRARVQTAWVDEGLPMGRLLLPPARKKKKAKRMRRRGALPTRCASRPCLFLFFLFVFSFLAFFLGGESGFEPREREAPTESASRALAIGMPRSLRAVRVRASDFIHWENARRATRQSAPAYKTRPPRARLGGLSAWLAQTRTPGPLGMPRGCVPRASSQVWLLRAGRESFGRSARQWARGRSKRPGRPLRRKSADVCVEGSNAVGSAGLQGRIGAF